MKSSLPRRPATLAGSAAIAAGALSGVVAWTGHGPKLALAAAAALGLVLLGRWSRGVALGMLTLLVLNGVPGIEAEAALPGQVAASTVFALAIIALLALWNLERPATALASRGRAWLFGWAAIFGGWWLFTLARSVLLDGVAVRWAVLFGHDFLVFALIAALAPGALRDKRDVQALVATLGAGAAVFSLAVIARGFLGFDASFVIHASMQSGTAGGFTKDFAAMTDLQNALAPFGLALLALGNSPSQRAVGACAATLGSVAAILQFTRATYFGLAFGLLLACLLWSSGSRLSGRRVVKAVTGLLVAAVVVIGVATIAVPSLPSRLPGGAVVERVAGGIQALQGNSGTVRLRYELARPMLDVLGDSWPVGLGFLHPVVHPVAGLAGGTIRDSNLGALNVIMTMGALGLIGLFAPLVMAIRALARSAAAPGDDEWLRFGTLVWLISLIAASPTLITLFSVPGAVLAAVLGVAGCRGLGDLTPEPALRKSQPARAESLSRRRAGSAAPG